MLIETENLIRIYLRIPEDQWCTDTYTSSDEEKYCAIGHLLYSKNANVTMRDYLCAVLRSSDNPFSDKLVITINDGKHSDYRQSTPKRRILKALFDKRREFKGPLVRFVESKNIKIKEEVLV